MKGSEDFHVSTTNLNALAGLMWTHNFGGLVLEVYLANLHLNV